MPDAFSFNREFDFVRLDGLRRVTGRPPHEWDIYIIKELIDNALDADEIMWYGDPKQFPDIHIRIEYIKLPAQKSQQLFISVSNRSLFPVGQLSDIFATQWYTSRKAFTKGLTRGALGNALKTLLGIPYALRHRVAGDWSPELKPLSILCNGTEYLPRFIVDSTDQTISFEFTEKEGRVTEGTVISIGLDHFEQEMPRTLEQIQQLAEEYNLCNPHFHFHWTVEIDDREWIHKYEADENPMSKYRGIAPVQWYSPSAFQELLGALYRQQSTGKVDELSLDTVCRYFLGFEDVANNSARKRKAVIESFGQDTLALEDIESNTAMQLYSILCRHGPRFSSNQLGYIGFDHIKESLISALPVDGYILYRIATDEGDDPSVPFVIEAALVRLKEGKRQIRTAINFAPTYADPFLRCWLQAQIQDEEPVLGLRGLMDAYGFDEDNPVFLLLHLICPNIEHHEFSKTEINHLPYKKVLSSLLHDLLIAEKEAQEEEEMRLEQTIFQALDDILRDLAEDERFVFDQLLGKLRVQLGQDPALLAWLGNPDASSRLRSYIANYQSQNTILTQYLAHLPVATLCLPIHPDRYYSISVDFASQELLDRHHVNKLLYVQPRELEPVAIENGWLCRMDMALLRSPAGSEELKSVITRCVVNSNVPILVLHNADDAGRAIVDQMSTWLREHGLAPDRIIDVGLDIVDGSGDIEHPTSFIEMMPKELIEWLIGRLDSLDIPLKSVPPDADIRSHIWRQFEQSLLMYFWEGASQKLGVKSAVDDIDRKFRFTKEMMDQQLDAQVKSRLIQESYMDSYRMVLDKTVEEFFEDFMHKYGTEIQKLMNAYIVREQGAL